MELSIEHFRNSWKSAVEELDASCQSWESLCEDDNIPDDVLGEIRTVIGLARLLKGQKLKQFCGLIDDSEFKTGEKEITLVDLQGFWDMVYCEVEKIQKSFKKLENCKDNAWIFVEEKVENVQPKKIVKNILPKKTDKTSAHAEAAKQRLAEIKKKMKLQQQKASESENISKPTDMLLVETNSSDKSHDDAPSPCKISKKDTSKPSKKMSKSKASPRKNSKSKAEKTSASQKKIAFSKQDKENTPANVQGAHSKKSKENLDCLAEKMFMEVEKRLTRSAKKAMLAKLEAAQN